MDDDAWQMVATHGSWREVEACGIKVHAFTLVCYLQKKVREWMQERSRTYENGDLVWISACRKGGIRRLTVLHERGEEDKGTLLWVGKMGNRYDYMYDPIRVPTTVQIVRMGMRGYEPRRSRG